MTLRNVVLSASVVLALAGCGGDTTAESPKADTKKNGGLYDTVDMCTLATDDQLKAALGEAPAEKERRDTDSLKACAVDGASGGFYLFLVMVRPASGAAAQLAYDKGAAAEPKDVDATTFSSVGAGEAHVETVSGELVLRASFVHYQGGGTITDGPAVVKRLHTLLGDIIRKT